MHQKTITGFINDYTIMPAQLIQDVDERIYRTFRDRCSDLNIDLGKAVTDALDMGGHWRVALFIWCWLINPLITKFKQF
jgi:hypothetical protein